MRRVAIGEVLSEEVYDRIVDDILSPSADPWIPLELEHFPQRTSDAPSVRLLSINEAEHVNALAGGQSLTFEAIGLNIIYGDNGSGKSGYARLLKQITGARHQEEVLSDVFKDTIKDKPTAVLSVHIGDQPEDIAWPAPARQELIRMHFYDGQCRDKYVSYESEFPYRPQALAAMDGLIKACSAVRDRIEVMLQKNAKSSADLPLVDDKLKETEVGQFLEKLSGTSPLEYLDGVATRQDELVKRLKTLKDSEASLSSSNSKAEKQRLLRHAEKLELMHKHIKRLQSVLGGDGMTNAQAVLEELKSAQRDVNLSLDPKDQQNLPGTGSTYWKLLWESARQYSEQLAYPKEPFPVVGDNSQCVLCQQTLDAEARARLKTFESFVRDNIQIRLDEASQSLETRVEQVKQLEIGSEAMVGYQRDLEPDFPDLMEDFTELLSTYEKNKEQMLGILSGTAQCESPRADSAPVLENLTKAITNRLELARNLDDPETVGQQLAKFQIERKEVELQLEIIKCRDTVRKEIERRGERKTLESLHSASATGSITKKIKEFSEYSVTEVVRDRFTRETQLLDLDRVSITHTRGKKGTLLHQPKLIDSRQTVKLRQVFSEGERTSLGLAAFFTEASLDASRSAIILDDPVTSLDHVRRPWVAARLAKFALNYQVIIFTHDVAFVADLKRAAKEQGISITERSVSISRATEGKTGICSQTHPWKAKDVKTRLHDLQVSLNRIKKDEGAMNQDQYEKEVSSWAGYLSETWERIISQEIVGRILANGGLEVRPRMVRIMAKFSNRDFREFDASYSRISQWAPRHDKRPLVNYVAPRISDLEKELRQVETWFARVKNYKN